MPVYEYRCKSCGHELEATQRIVDPPLSECPACHTPQLERLISMTSFQLKGSGWYKDGYGSKKGPERTDNQVTDRLTKAIDDDKAKTAAAATPEAPAAGTASSTPSTTTSTASSEAPSSGGGSDTGKSPV